MRWGRWWAVQWCLDGWISLGVHIDFRSRITSGPEPTRYGPYLDLHLVCAIISLGVQPIYSGDLDAVSSVSRGGVRAH